MSELSDHELLAEFARSQSETAFAELVARQVNLVYSTALRFSGNAHHAEEITQAVFVILAGKAGKLSSRQVLSGWLYQTARLTAANFIKGEHRRQRREQEAYMQSTLNETNPAAWEQIAPWLDEAMGHLGETDRTAVVLRYFENKTAAETAAALQLTEAAAQKRVNRALEKLRRLFSKHGVMLSTALIASAVSAGSVSAAPAGLAATVTVVAVNGATLSVTLTTLVKGTMKTMTWLKFKFAVGLTILLVGGVATVALSQPHGGGLSAREIAQKSRQAYAALASYSDTGTVTFEMPGQAATTTSFQTRLQRPNQYRIDWTQESGLAGAAWSGGTGDYLQIRSGNPANPAAIAALIAARQGDNSQPQKMFNMKAALAGSTGLSGSAASTVPGTFFDQDLGDVFVAPVISGRHPLQREPDARVGQVDCYVVSSDLDFSQIPDNGGKPGTAATTLWIGKQDWLIHQCRTKYVEKVDERATSDQAIDEAIKQTLAIQKQPVTPAAVAAMRPQMRLIMKQVQGTLKTSFEAGVVFTQTHDNLIVNRRFAPEDFVR